VPTSQQSSIPRQLPPQQFPPQQRVHTSVIIPTLNEAANLPHVFARLPFDRFDELIIVDGRSTDDTVAVARRLCPRARVILQDGTGKGNALACGFSAAAGDYIVMLDADGSTDPAEIVDFILALDEGADFAKGSRFAGTGSSEDLTPLRRAGNRFLNIVVNSLYRTRYTDLCYGYNAFRTNALTRINLNCDGFEVEALMSVRAARAGLQVTEVPSVERERIHGISKLHPARDGLRVLRTILRERVRRSPAAEQDWRREVCELPAEGPRRAERGNDAVDVAFAA
jgi:glycosyltransferase involved in cell wall biosynthesis